MYTHDWERYLKEGGAAEIGVAQLSPELTAHLGASSRTVYLGHEYAVKSATKHRVPPEHFPVIFDTVEFGTALADRPAQITFIHRDQLYAGRWFQVSVKCCFEQRHIFIKTFHRLRDRDMERLLRSHPVIRAAKSNGRPDDRPFP